ncbi:hypothetical protein OCHUTO_0260 [Orientia chuto str. Dubai]|uniref:Uncharacterized protein n=1 Tax=Orientia chuto str. Dubai TaxID=1359168 RepID=A0A0F3MR58_9RICK|nr:hypothetical protein OCHUTO_0260 [Orientia chuto str. Dubai]
MIWFPIPKLIKHIIGLLFGNKCYLKCELKLVTSIKNLFNNCSSLIFSKIFLSITKKLRKFSC